VPVLPSIALELTPRVNLDIPTPTLAIGSIFEQELLSGLEATEFAKSVLNASDFADTAPKGYGLVTKEHIAKNQLELNLEEDDIVRVFSDATKENMLFGSLNGVMGWFPMSCIQLLSRKQIEEENLEPIGSVPAATSENDIKALQADAAADGRSRRISDQKSNIRKSAEELQNEEKKTQNPLHMQRNRTPGQRPLWKDLYGAEAIEKEGVSKQEVKRQEVIWEIISTEQDYVQDLTLTCQVPIIISSTLKL
jgi:DNA gyrase/topoisomerase IV subunit A